jgi:hypothetical protein
MLKYRNIYINTFANIYSIRMYYFCDVKMEINYRYYEPNSGFEEIQATIFNQANNRNVKAKEIQERFEREKIDHHTVRYAFDKENNPLAYIQARDYENQGEVHVGFPWAFPDCPSEVQGILFDELLTYVKNRDSSLKIKANTTSEENRINFVKKRGFKEEARTFQFEIDLDSISHSNLIKPNYKIQKAHSSDLDAIKQCYVKALGHLGRSDNEAFINLAKQRIKEGYTYLAFEGEELVGVCTNRLPNSENPPEQEIFLGLNLFFTLLGKENCMPNLMKNALEVSKKENWNKNFIQIVFTNENSNEMKILNQICKDSKTFGIKFGL